MKWKTSQEYNITCYFSCSDSLSWRFLALLEQHTAKVYHAANFSDRWKSKFAVWVHFCDCRQSRHKRSAAMAESSVKVGVRIRPLLPREGHCQEIVAYTSETQVKVKDKLFTFDYVFPQHKTQAGEY